MKTYLLIFSILICSKLFSQTPVFDGAIILDGTQNSAHYTTNCFADPTGILHVSGQFFGICDFDPSPNVASLNANNGYPCYVARYNNQLELIWVKMLIGNGDSTGLNPTKVMADAAGNTIVAGFHNNTFDADPGLNVQTIAGFPFSNSGFIVSLNASGNYNWSAQFGNANNNCRIYDFVQTSNGHFHFCGDFNDSIDFDPGPNTQLRVADGNTSGSFVLELNADGSFAKVITWDNLDVLRCIDKDEFDNIYVGGAYSGSTDFDPGVGTYILNSSFFNLTGIALSIDTSGGFRWAANFINANATNTSVVKDIAYANSILAVTGQFNLSIDADPGTGIQVLTAAGNYDHFHVGLGSNLGNFVWGGRTGGTQVDDIRSIATDQNGDFWINGISQGNVDLDLNPNNVITYFLGANAVPWVMRLSNAGNLGWVGFQGGQFLNGNYDNSITTNMGAIYWMGNIASNMNLDPVGSSFPTSTNDYYSAFITKLCIPIQSNAEFALCPGDSLFVQGAWQHQAGVYTDIFPRIDGCDSTVTTVIYEANLNINLGNDTAFCNGQLFIPVNNIPGMNVLWNTGDNTPYLIVDSTGLYSVTVSSTNGSCSASDTINVFYGLQVNTPILPNTFCLNTGIYALPDGNPSGGSWSGIAVNNNVFDPLIAGIGNHWLYYSYTDSSNCSGADSLNITVDLCVGNYNYLFAKVNIYPNPTKDKVTIQEYNNSMKVVLYDMYGRQFPNMIDEFGELSLEDKAIGAYSIQITFANGASKTYRIIKN
jgi:hypothetical protein